VLRPPCYTCRRLRKSLIAVNTLERLKSLEKIKVLADPRRLRILRLLMEAPATLTQLGLQMGKSPAWIRHHIKSLESVGLVTLESVRTTGRITEKYYGAVASGLFLEDLILPAARTPVTVFSGSHDLAFQSAAEHLAPRQEFLAMFTGSLNGLAYLRRGMCHIVGAHLLDTNGEYNTPYVRHFFPDRGVTLLTLAHRTQGLMTAAGNPQSLHGVQDLARPGMRFVNRNPGSGTRIRLDREVQAAGIPASAILGYDVEVNTHTQAARLIQGGRADAAIGLEAAAVQHGLDFQPWFDERYDLILFHESEHDLLPLLDYVQSADYRQEISSLAGYNTAHSGEQILL
jgi:molybdate-binding protein/DNA-binding transcriptional ArsR family regulator